MACETTVSLCAAMKKYPSFRMSKSWTALLGACILTSVVYLSLVYMYSNRRHTPIRPQLLDLPVKENKSSSPLDGRDAQDNSTNINDSMVNSPDGKDVHTMDSRGYVLALNYSDQMSGSSMNLVSLQCWAKESNLDLLVVEPYIIQSWFGASLRTGEEGLRDNAVKMSDIFDIDVWQKYAEKKGYSSLASWERFISRAPRKLIIAVQPPHGHCDEKMDDLRSRVSPFAKEHGFSVVRKVCINFFKTGKIQMVEKSEFINDLYGNYSASEVTVLFRRWGGINDHSAELRRMLIHGSKCSRHYEFMKQAPRKSKSISNDEQRYIDKYFNGSDSYIAVMVRFEYYFIRHELPSKSDEEQISMVDQCIQSIVSTWKTLSTEHSLQNTLLAMDFGKLGSGSIESRSNTTWMEGKVRGLLNDIYGPSLSLEKWEESFETIASKKATGYMAILQKELGARGQCLILAGSGGESAFHLLTSELYRKYHSGTPLCISNNICG